MKVAMASPKSIKKPARSKPDVDQIDGLSPAIAIEQKASSHNPRSTVGTVTEIHDYLRLLYEIGRAHV